ncbi:MAG: ankyrin repeat domain-containing protein [Micavibrio sp.]|nr:ankyrin repeat domain-containing protein [Micavibrio sp.]
MPAEPITNTFNAESKPVITPPEAKQFFEAAQRNDMPTVLRFIMENPDAPKWKSAEGMTGLMYAAREGAREAAWIIIKSGHPVDEVNPNGSTALMFAAFTGKAVIAELLLKAGADINHINTNGHTALMSAAAHDFKNTVTLLLRFGADVTPKDGDGLTALDYVRENGYTDILQPLVDAGIKQAEDKLSAAEAAKKAAAEAEVPGAMLKPTNDDNTERLRQLEKNLLKAKLV